MYFTRPLSERQQARFEFYSNLWYEAKKPLHVVQNGKCAFCESAAKDGVDLDLHFFRPNIATNDGGHPVTKTWPDHYWWLAYKWDNMLVICRSCNANKRNLFPIAGNRAEPEAVGKALDLERPLLINPYREDPSEYLRFDHDGTVRGIGPKGETTVAICGLNRPALVRARKEAMADQRRSGERDVPDHAEFAAARRTVSQSASFVTVGSGGINLRGSAETSFSMNTFRYVQSVEIENFRAIDKAKIQIPFGREETGGWKVLLGENSAGKSTVLKAIAMALMGEEHLAQLQLAPEEILHRKKAGNEVKTAKSGFIKVTMSDGPPIEIRFSKSKIAFKAGGEGVRGPVRGYGSMRLLPEDGNTVTGEGAGCDVSNLFNPRATLVDAERRMVQLHQEDKRRFHRFAKNLKALLRLDKRQKITVDRKGKLRIHLNGVPIGVDELSDGYQSMLALGVDLMNAFAKDAEMEYEAGILVVDELGTHLHPRWRMEIVNRLRTTFRRLQVIATTHEPLCLHGLHEKEAVLLKRGADGRLELREEEDGRSVKGMRVDQILMSPLFGLESTIDPTTEEEFQAYYHLLGKSKLTAKERKRLEELRVALRPHRALGYTRRDQMLYDMIDTYLAQEKSKPPKERVKLRAKTMEDLRRAWMDFDFAGLAR